MKFGKQLDSLALPKYRGYYVQYKELKKAIKVFTGQERNQSTVQEVTHWTSSFLRLGPNPEVVPEMRLQEILARERDRIGKFCELEEDVLQKKLRTLAEDCQNGGKGVESWEELRRRLDELGEEVVAFRNFTQLNFSALRKLLKKYDKWSKLNVSPWFMTQVARSSMMTVDYEQLVASLNSIAATLKEKAPAASSKNHELLNENTALSHSVEWNVGSKDLVFFVSVKDTMRVKVELAKSLAIAGAVRIPAQPKQRTVCTFFDTSDLEVYSALTGDAESCGSVHLRHTGGDIVTLVCGDRAEAARREALLTRSDVSRLINGDTVAAPTGLPAGSSAPLSTASPLTGSAAKEALNAAQSVLRSTAMQPLAQASYFRSVFFDKSAGLTVVLDEGVRIAQTKRWDSTPVSTQSFPSDVLSISFSPGAQHTEMPKWLRQIYNSADLFQVSGFSKAAHAIAHFHAKARGLPLPHWYKRTLDIEDDKEEKDSNEDKQEKEEKDSVEIKPVKADTITVSAPSSAGSAMYKTFGSNQKPSTRLVHEFGSGKETASGGGLGSDVPPLPHLPSREAAPTSVGNDLNAPLLGDSNAQRPEAESEGAVKRILRLFGEETPSFKNLPVRTAIVTVQPKTLYSNERTFLEWIHFSTILAALGLGVLHAASTATEVAMGRFLVMAAIFLTVWSLQTFNWRAEALDNKEIRNYHDPVGPVVLMCSLLFALTASSLHAVGALQLGGEGGATSPP